jgi:agmatine deiminase
MAVNLIGAVKYVTMLVNGPEDIVEVTEMVKERGGDANALHFKVVPRSEEWIRDFGPIFLRSPTGLRVASFGWNHWGCLKNYCYDGIEEEVEESSKVSERCANQLGLPVVHSNLVSEGGNREFNGDGVMLATSTVELQRNPTMTLESIEAEFKRIFNVKKVIWLKQGVADDDHIFLGPRPSGADGTMLEFNAGVTGGHIDEYCKFVSPTKVLLAEVPEHERETPLGAKTHERMEENLKILSSPSSCNVDGTPLEIIRIPTPPTMRITIERDDPMWEWIEQITFDSNGTSTLGKDLLASHSAIHVVLPASYVNMIICNRTILIPKYGCEEKVDSKLFHFMTPEQNEKAIETDLLAKKVLQKCFPEYKIIQIPSVPALNLGGGGMHCCSQQQPAPL